MKYINILLLCLTTFVLGCHTSVDKKVVRNEICEVLDQYHQGMKQKQAMPMMALLNDSGLYCGTDPSELWDKKTIYTYIRKAFTNPNLTINDYVIENREILISEDGKTATVVEQFKMDVISSSMQVRFISHLSKLNEQWKFDFFSLSPIPTNNDLEKVNHCLMDTSSSIEK